MKLHVMWGLHSLHCSLVSLFNCLCCVCPGLVHTAAPGDLQSSHLSINSSAAGGLQASAADADVAWGAGEVRIAWWWVGQTGEEEGEGEVCM